ncbi:uncharacterized protein LOC110105198 [Dendrobium catenatum]|uniref:uncharacterized protein LOC110105198 n=1 Tax=Dendrobium catenatum TaxID=906689 RepID=UPI0009F6DCC6|nr:uncharacterized protein LOC110105198 [Dendrobium catenatum]
MNAFMNNCDFHDVGFIRPKFTWCNNKQGGARILERLDRYLINSEALKSIQPALVHHLGRIASDHCPLILNILNSGFRKQKKLQFEDIWASFPASKAIVSKTWRKSVRGDDVQVLNTKFRRVLKALFHWSRSKHSNLNSLKKELKKDIIELQEEEANSGGLSEDKICLLKFKVKELNSSLGRLSSWWKQRAKVKWIKDGDSNTEYFYSVASTRQRLNFINQIRNLKGWLSEEPECIEDTF